MNDITKCNSNECAWKYKCYRYKIEPNEYQSYANLLDICKATGMINFIPENT
jgi:hypothetical protein